MSKKVVRNRIVAMSKMIDLTCADDYDPVRIDLTEGGSVDNPIIIEDDMPEESINDVEIVPEVENGQNAFVLDMEHVFSSFNPFEFVLNSPDGQSYTMLLNTEYSSGFDFDDEMNLDDFNF